MKRGSEIKIWSEQALQHDLNKEEKEKTKKKK